MTKFKTFFANAKRSTKEKLDKELGLITNNQIIDGVLLSAESLLAILNEDRQVLKVNNSFLRILGIEDSNNIFGLRPGEVINCKYSDIEEGGCGTSKFCKSCGAAIAIVSSINSEEPVHRFCTIDFVKDGVVQNIAFNVRAHTISIKDNKFTLLFLKDISKENLLETANKTFFHDIKNLLNGIIGSSEVLSEKDPKCDIRKAIYSNSMLLLKELELHRELISEKDLNYTVKKEHIDLKTIIKHLRYVFKNHPSKRDKSINFNDEVNNITILTDTSILYRILINMLKNALEATPKYSVVKFWIEINKSKVNFNVYNAQVIPEEVQLRIFQKHFSTKGDKNRGLGTYSMKLYGEKFLNGKVDFISSHINGTIFTLSIPV